MASTTPPNVSPFEAAVRQLVSAIDLFASDGDAIAVHTLTMAAFELSSRLMNVHGLKSFQELTVAAHEWEVIEKGNSRCAP